MSSLEARRSTPQHVRVRAATVDDIPAILDLLHLLHEETPHAPLDDDRLLGGVIDCLRDGVVLLSLDAWGDPVGTVGLSIDSPWFSRESWLCDRWMFVHPHHRRTPHAHTLLQECKRAAEHYRIPLHMAVTGHGPRIAGKIRLFARVLGQATGALWTVRS